jgi:four helix bundle protein
MAVKSFHELIVWQKAMALVERVYLLSADFPKDEQYGLTAQLRRATVSIPSNIAEGQCRGSSRDFARFLAIARGSLAEVETQLLLTARLQFVDASKVDALIENVDEIGRLLRGLTRSLDNP